MSAKLIMIMKEKGINRKQEDVLLKSLSQMERPFNVLSSFSVL